MKYGYGLKCARKNNKESEKKELYFLQNFVATDLKTKIQSQNFHDTKLFFFAKSDKLQKGRKKTCE